MTAPELLAQLRDLDVRVWAEGERIRLNAPRGTLTSDLRAELATRKGEILAFLRTVKSVDAPAATVVAVQPHGSQPPFFAVPGHNGDVFCFVHLARHLGSDQPFYALQPPGLDGRSAPFRTIEDLAGHFVRELRAASPGPYRIGGFCVGGSMAFEVARQLAEQGEEVLLLALMGCAHPEAFRPASPVRASLRELSQRLGRQAMLLRRSPLKHLRHAARVARDRAVDGANRRGVERAAMSAIRMYFPRPFPGRVTIFLPNEDWARTRDLPLSWRDVAGGGLEVIAGPPDCDGDTMLREPHVRWLAGELQACLGRAAKG